MSRMASEYHEYRGLVAHLSREKLRASREQTVEGKHKCESMYSVILKTDLAFNHNEVFSIWKLIRVTVSVADVFRYWNDQRRDV